MKEENLDMFEGEIPEDALERLEDPEIRAKWPQTLTDMIGVIEGVYLRAGDTPEAARRRAFRAVRALAGYMGGRVLYLPKGDSLDRFLRDREIWERFDGTNIDELARRFERTTKQIYQIIAEQRAIQRKRSQPDLFGSG